MTFSRVFKSYIPVLLTAVFAFLILQFILQIAYIPSSSMEPTIKAGSFVVGSRLSSVTKGDIVIFEKDNVLLCKRIIAEGGDVVEIKNGNYYVNNKKETHGSGKTESTVSTFHVPDSCYFVSGDNRMNSNDSRVWKNPYVRQSDIKSKVAFYSGKEE